MHLLSVFSLRNRALIALVTIVVGIFGGIALTTLKQELLPSFTLPQLVIVSNYPGASPEVVNEDVSTPIETAIQGVAGLDSTTATSRANISTVSASFSYGTNITTVEQKVQLAINRIANTLPDGVEPQVITGSIEDFPVIQIAVTSDLDPRDLSERLKASTITDLTALDGVREASLTGTTGQRIEITPSTKNLKKYKLTVQAIRDALDNNGTLLPSGQITENDQTLVVQAGDRVDSVKMLSDLPVLGATKGGSAASAPAFPGAPATPGTPGKPRYLTISDVATVKLADDPVESISRVDGEPSLTIGVTKTPDGNTVAVSHLVRDLIPSLEKDVGGNTTFTVVFDQAPFIEKSIESLTTEGLLGLAFAVLVILVFLLSIRSTLVTAISIPASVLITFIGMLASGYTLNIITLGALTIAIGRVVDDSIVVTENIKRHLGLGEEKLVAIRNAVREVAGAVTASTATTVAVFLPLAFVGDITGELFRPFALTVTIALAASLFVSLTIVPVLSYWFLRSPKVTDVAAARVSDEDELANPNRLQRAYLPILRFTLKRPVAVIIVSVLLLIGTGALLPNLKTNFIGNSGQNTLTVVQTLPLGTSLEAKDRDATVVEKALREVKGVETVQLSIGSDGTSLRQAFGGGGDVTFSLTTDETQDQDALQARVRNAVKALDGVGDVSLQAAQSGFSSSDISITVQAIGEEDLRTATTALTDAVKDLDVVAEATNNIAVEQPYIAVVVNREKAAKAGVSDLTVGRIVAEAMNPTAAGSIVIDDTTLSIYIENPKKPLTVAALKKFDIATQTGTKDLSELATVREVNAPAAITTIRGVRSATVTVTPNSQDVGRASLAVAAAVDKVDLPAGASADIGGVTEQQNTAFNQLLIALLVAILVVYIVMVATFRSLRQPLLLLVSVPFAATGAIALQLISDIPLGTASFIGLIMLVGIVVTNAIVLIDLVNQYRERGMLVGDAILHGASRRLRPILMTALATIFALLPLGLGLSGNGGGFISQPLAIVVIGGLVSSTVLTLVVLPTLYYLVEGFKERRPQRIARRAARREARAAREAARAEKKAAASS